MHEALALGVPIVPFPFFDDQHYIAVRLEELYGYAAAASAAVAGASRPFARQRSATGGRRK